MKLFLRLLIALPLLLPGLARALSPTILDPEHARFDKEMRLVLKARTDIDRPVVPPSLAFTLNPADPQPADATLRLVLDSEEPAELELQARYADGGTFLMTRRQHVDRPGADSILWRLPLSDKLTTFTLALRSPKPIEGRLDLVALDPSDSLGFASRILAESPAPIRVLDPLQPIKDGNLQLLLQLPRGTAEAVLGSEVEFRIDGKPHVFTIEPVRREKESGAVFADVAVPITESTPNPVSIYLYDDALRRATAEILVDLTPVSWNGRFIPDQSVQEVSALVRNGELCIYTVAAPPGVPDSSLGVRHPGETVWLSVTPDLKEWVAEQPVLRSRRDNPALAGGIGALAVTSEGPSVLAAFTMTDLQGLDSIYLASAINSLRVVPISANPIVAPSGARLGGQALLTLPKGRLLLSLAESASSPTLMAFAGNQLPNWLDLGRPVAPVLLPGDTELSGFSHEGTSVLLVGKPWRLYTSTNPLFSWEQVSVSLPDDIASVRLVPFNGRVLYVGVTHRNGFGVIRWGDLESSLALPGLKGGAE